jgi:hypothetical protein
MNCQDSEPSSGQPVGASRIRQVIDNHQASLDTCPSPYIPYYPYCVLSMSQKADYMHQRPMEFGLAIDGVEIFFVTCNKTHPIPLCW